MIKVYELKYQKRCFYIIQYEDLRSILVAKNRFKKMVKNDYCPVREINFKKDITHKDFKFVAKITSKYWNYTLNSQEFNKLIKDK